MTTSSDHRVPSIPFSHGDHWLDLTATLPRESTDEFGDWLGRQLSLMEKELYSYITPQSLSGSSRQPAVV